MAVIGSVAFGCVVGWAVCFISGWRPGSLLARILWVATIALVILTAQAALRTPLLIGMLAGGLGHVIIVNLIRNRPIGPYRREEAG